MSPVESTSTRTFSFEEAKNLEEDSKKRGKARIIKAASLSSYGISSEKQNMRWLTFSGVRSNNQYLIQNIQNLRYGSG